MKKRNLEIGICGTFDVENYGDLLFPLIAEAELSSRLGAVTLHRFSYHSKAEPEWPFRVEALVDLPRAAQELDGMIIGGGDVVRFDKDVAPGYLPPSPGVHHPTGYWLAPALIASQSGLPVAWNAPGVVQEVPEWASPLVTAAVQASAYVSVRDRASQQKLLPFAGGKAIEVVPDSVFGIGRMVRERSPSSSAADLRKALGLNKPYLVVHAQGGSGAFLDWARAHHKALSRFQIVALPVGPVLGDSDAHLFDGVRNVVRLPKWPRPLTIAEMIRGAEGIVGASLHLAITAVALGVPAFRPALHSGGKYALLSDFEGVFSAPTDGDAAWFISKLGPKPISRQAEAAAQRTARHWDAIAECMGRAAEVSPVKRSVNELWQALPAAFENQGLREARISELSSQLQERGCELEERRREIATLEEGRRQSLERVGQLEREVEGREQRIAELTRALGEREEQLNGFRKSKSWRVTAPGRWAGRTLRRVAPRESGSVLNFERLSRQVMAAEPYRYAAATGAFARRDGLALVRSFPHDHYKTVQGYDGEKGYAYEARALIHMGAPTPSHAEGLSDVWKRFSGDLLSPRYRAAMTELTGLDLTHLPMEAYFCHYGSGAWLGPHIDLKDKLATHIFYFNVDWKVADGGYLNVLRSGDEADVVDRILPNVGNSAILVRSERSWHSVARVAERCERSRRSLNVIFYRPEAVSTMWPPGDSTPLHTFTAADEPLPRRAPLRMRLGLG